MKRYLILIITFNITTIFCIRQSIEYPSLGLPFTTPRGFHGTETTYGYSLSDNLNYRYLAGISSHYYSEYSSEFSSGGDTQTDIRLFKQAYPDVATDSLGFQHAANAIAAFETDAFTLTDSPWDHYLKEEDEAISYKAKRGALLFFEEANCAASCHKGLLMNGQEYHNLGVPQIGPGKENTIPLDVGRFSETGDKKDLFAFRTPPPGNVALTGPWTHNGAYNALEDAISHHLDAVTALNKYNARQPEPALKDTFQGSQKVINRIPGNLDPKVSSQKPLSGQNIQEIIAFLEALTDSEALNLEKHLPESVPSGLSVEVLDK